MHQDTVFYWVRNCYASGYCFLLDEQLLCTRILFSTGCGIIMHQDTVFYWMRNCYAPGYCFLLDEQLLCIRILFSTG